MSALYIVPILALLILAHEIGHFVTARLVGIRVEEFGIGLPPRLFGIRRGGVIYSINLIPLGGFVRVLGEDGKNFNPDSMQAKSRLQRTLFMSAGSLMNFLVAIVLITAIIGVQGEPRTNVYISEVQPNSPAQEAGWQAGDRLVMLGGQRVTSAEQAIATTERFAGRSMPATLLRAGQRIETEVVPRENPPPDSGRVGMIIQGSPQATLSVSGVEPNSAAAAAGLQPGDRLLAVAGQPADDGSAYTLMIRNNAGETVPVLVERDGQQLTLDLAIPAITGAETQINTGLQVTGDIIYYGIPWWKVIPRGLSETFSMFKQMVNGLIMVIRGAVPFEGITGPIGMGQLTSEVLSASAAPTWVTLANLTALLSLNLGLLNLLPIPALDGGRLFFVLIEAIRGKRVPPEKEGLVHFVGLVILLAFMVVVAFGDIDRLISGQSLLQ